MANPKHFTLADGLAELGKPFEQFNGIADTESLPISGATARNCINLIRMLHHLALIQERELGALRMLVGDLPGRREATTKIQQEGNVIRPDFRGKKDDR